MTLASSRFPSCSLWNTSPQDGWPPLSLQLHLWKQPEVHLLGDSEFSQVSSEELFPTGALPLGGDFGVHSSAEMPAYVSFLLGTLLLMAFQLFPICFREVSKINKLSAPKDFLPQPSWRCTLIKITKVEKQLSE